MMIDDGNIKYEGEYINGVKFNGKGYDKKNNIIYEIKDGMGYIKEFYNDGNLKFEGDYLDGELYGKGKEYYSNGALKFEGN